MSAKLSQEINPAAQRIWSFIDFNYIADGYHSRKIIIPYGTDSCPK